MSERRHYHVSDYGHCKIDETDIPAVSSISNRTLSKLCGDKNSKLLIYPHVLNAFKDDIDKGVICNLDDDVLQAGDILGFIGRGDVQLTIHSRFAKNDRDDHFLHYLIQKVFSINLFDLKHESTSDPIFDFLVFLFPYHLKMAMRQGLFRKYQTNQYNDAKVRGVVEIARHIRQNLPFVGNVSYHNRELTTDNAITQLVRHTIEYISGSSYASILKVDADTRDAVECIRQATPSYSHGNLQKVLWANNKPIQHPYYTLYTSLQRLCIQILNHKGLKFGSDNDDIYGLLFSGSWLWEEYLNTILRQAGFHHPENKTGKGKRYLFEPLYEGNAIPSKCERYPDFYSDDKILDAKYKHLHADNIDRNDMHQMITYMHVEDVEYGGFLYPCCGTRNSIVSTPLGTLRGKGGSIFMLGIPIPEASDYKSFCGQMRTIEDSLKHYVKP